MVEYLAQRIINAVYTYAFVIGKRPDLKAGIDQVLTGLGQTNLIN